jgi:DNA polymerase-3 subunit delta'
MAWLGIEGHDAVVEKFRRALARGRLASTYLFLGQAGTGKRTFAERFAQVLLCNGTPPVDMNPCGGCPACQQVIAGTHPDLERVSLPKEKKFIPVETFIGDRDHRSREGFCHNLSMKPFMGGRKVGIIDDADCLNEEGANCLLKTLEEPPPKSVLILIGTSADKQLPTIRSRCQVIRFQPLAADVVAELLVQNQITSDRAEAQKLAQLSEGGLTRATNLAVDGLWEFRGDFLDRLAESPLDTIRVIRSVTSFVEQSTKEPAAKRQKLSFAIDTAIEYYRRALQDHTTACVESCLQAQINVDRNANVNAVIEHWLDELAKNAAA